MIGNPTHGQPRDPICNPSFRAKRADAFSALPLLRKVGPRREKSLFASFSWFVDLLLRPLRLNLLLCSALLVLAFGLNAQAPTAVPIPKEPHHHLVFENSYVRVFRVSVPAREATLLHQHDVPYVYVALGAADVINAVQGKPEVRLVLTDGQVNYSRGGFAHIARNESGMPFNNVTIELLHPQGEPRNLCEKIIDGPLNDCQNSGTSKVPSDSALKEPPRIVKMEKLFETDEVLAESISLATKASYIQSGSQPSQLLIALDNSEVRVDVHGKPSKSLNSGEVLWLEAGNPPTIVDRDGHGVARFVLLSFKN